MAVLTNFHRDNPHNANFYLPPAFLGSLFHNNFYIASSSKSLLTFIPAVNEFYSMPIMHVLFAIQHHKGGGPSWICQDHTYVFAHCRYLDLLVCPLWICQTQPSAFAVKWYQSFFWGIAGFLPKLLQYFSSPIICILRHVISPHLSEFVVFFTAHQSEFTRPIHFQSALSALGIEFNWTKFKKTATIQLTGLKSI